MAPEIFGLLDQMNASETAGAITEVEGRQLVRHRWTPDPMQLLFRTSRPHPQEDGCQLAGRVFLELLERYFPDSSAPDLEQSKRRTIGYVSGFNEPTGLGGS